jgi:hypothetical protein
VVSENESGLSDYPVQKKVLERAAIEGKSPERKTGKKIE